MTDEVADMAATLAKSQVAGTLRFFGDWFGRPHDNIHRLIGVEATGDALVLQFDEGETLLIEKPRRLTVLGRGYPGPQFVIANAARVRWEWFYYGREKSAGNRHYIEYTKGADFVSRTSDWPAALQDGTTQDASKPAVELF